MASATLRGLSLRAFAESYARIMQEATASGFRGFGGYCTQAALVINEIVFGESGEIYAGLNEFFYPRITRKGPPLVTNTITIPDLCDTQTVSIFNDRIAFASIANDESAPNPLDDDDSNGAIYSFNSRHPNFIGRVNGLIERFEAQPDVVRLGYFEHGQRAWFISPDEEFAPPITAGVEFRWDGRRYAGLWVPNDEAKRNIEAFVAGNPLMPRREIVVKYAAAVCEEYTSWINSEVYHYRVTAYEALRDSEGTIIEDEQHYAEHAQPVYEDACGGYYTEDALQENVRAALECGLTMPKRQGD
jgi:hypothetical protein